MAISFDNSLAINISTGNQTLSYTCTGSNGYLVVGTLAQASGTCTGVTYNGVAMTQISSLLNDGVSGLENIYLFGLANPATGANNIIASFSGSVTTGVLAVSYAGVAQSGQPEASNTTSGSSTSFGVSVTTLTNNAWLVGYFRCTGTMTAGANTTLRSAASNINMCDTNAPQTPAGSYSLNATQATGSFALQAIALAPFVAPTTNSKFFFALAQ